MAERVTGVEGADIVVAYVQGPGHRINQTAVIDSGPNKGGKAVYLRDPDGITIEFIQPPPG